ncbi:DNA-directed DNA polymerase alpha catalytic subunit pol1, partial [Ascosphaera atra]
MAAARKRQQLEELRKLRASGKKRLSTYEVEEEGDIYDEVDEDNYKRIVRRRLDQDDFVTGDDDLGYADDGREEWDVEDPYSDDDDDDVDVPSGGKAAKRKREEEEKKKEQMNNGIQKYFNRGAAVAAQKPKPTVTTAEDEAFLADLLAEVDSRVAVPTHKSDEKKAIKSDTRRKVRIVSPPPYKKPPPKRNLSSPVDAKSEDDVDMVDDAWNAEHNDDNLMSDPLPSSPVAKAVERKAEHPNGEQHRENGVKEEQTEEDEFDDDMMIVEQVAADSSIKPKEVNITGSRPPPKIKAEPVKQPASSPAQVASQDYDVDASLWNDLNKKLNIVNSPAASPAFQSFGKMPAQDAVESDGSLQFFWLDYLEVHGSLCLFGKVQSKKTGQFVSAFVKVDNILRKLYFLPRDYRVKGGRETDEEVGMEDVYQEVDNLMSRLRVKRHKIKPSTRKYAFELPDIPKEAEYLKLLYGYDCPPLSMDIQGETFAHVFGTNTALFEQFVLWKRIMGPCWLNIKNADFTSVNGASWCKLECQVDNPQDIAPLPNSDNMEPPKLTLM